MVAEIPEFLNLIFSCQKRATGRSSFFGKKKRLKNEELLRTAGLGSKNIK
jgi:hypothetical protein